MSALLVAVGGGLGAVARFLLDSWVARHNRTSYPLGTLLINVSGSLLLGLLTGWSLYHGGLGAMGPALGVGALGGYTTFSTASVEGVRLMRADRRTDALLLAGAMLVVSVLAATLGIWLMSL